MSPKPLILEIMLFRIVKPVAKYVFLLLFLWSALRSQGQDIQFSQFYAAQTYLSPSFAGSTHHTRGMFHQRIQWPRLEAKYITSMASFDKYFAEYNSGVGLVVLRDQQGSGEIVSYSAELQYAYELHVTKNITVRPGLSASYVFRNNDYSNLTFASQYSEADVDFTGANPYGSELTQYFDFASGAIGFTKNAWVGLFAHHMNRPRINLFQQDERYPIRWTVVGGYKIHLRPQNKITFADMEHEFSITPTFHYKAQGKSDQIDLGIYGHYDHLLLGVWYRGIPFKKLEPQFQNNESMVFSAGWRYHRWTIGYSFDWVVSTLSRGTVGGAHEINLTFINLRKFRKRRVMKRIPCPDLFSH